MRKTVFLILLGISLQGFAQYDGLQFKKNEADEYFQAGRYWDAFFLYRDLAKTTAYQGDYTIENQIKNSSKALFHWRKTENYRAYQQYELAKSHMKELLTINPSDPNRGLLPILTLELANQMKRRAIASPTKQGEADYLAKALEFYNLALNEGLKDDMVFSFIRQVENSLDQNPYSSKVKQPTSYDINYQKDKAEKARTVEILQRTNNQ